MDSFAVSSENLFLARLYSSSASTGTASSSLRLHRQQQQQQQQQQQLPCLFFSSSSSSSRRRSPSFAVSATASPSLTLRFDDDHRSCKISAVSSSDASSMAYSMSPNNRSYTVGDFMTRKADLRVVKPTTTVEEALEILVEHRITGFPVINDDWKLVGLVSDYDLLALDSISGGARVDASMFPEVDRTWKTFNEIQKLLSKTNGQVIGDLMTPAPLVVHEATNLEDAARLLLETKYRRLPVVDSDGKLVGIITRGNVVRAALLIKREIEKDG